MRPIFQRTLDNSDQFSAKDSAKEKLSLDDTVTLATQLRAPFSPPPERALVARQDGASLHAGVTIHRAAPS